MPFGNKKERTKIIKAFEAEYHELPDDKQIQNTELPKSWDIEQIMNVISYISEYYVYKIVGLL